MAELFPGTIWIGFFQCQQVNDALAGLVDRCDWLWLRDIVVEVEALEAEELDESGAGGWNVKGARLGFRLAEEEGG